jgi:hypothetical protein
MLVERRGKPGMIVSDKLDRVDLDRNARLGAGQQDRVAFHCARKANQNGFCGSFNSRMHDELLNESLFIDIDLDLARSIGAGNSAEASSIDIMGTYRGARVDVSAYQHQPRNK